MAPRLIESLAMDTQERVEQQTQQAMDLFEQIELIAADPDARGGVSPTQASSTASSAKARIWLNGAFLSSRVSVSSGSGCCWSSAAGATSSAGRAVAATVSSRRRRAWSLRLHSP